MPNDYKLALEELKKNNALPATAVLEEVTHG
jgi:hypothetical protein